MKLMKKVTSIILSIALVMSMISTFKAADTKAVSATKNVKVK